MDKVQKASDSECYIQHGQNPSECKKKTRSLEMLELVMARVREQRSHEMLQPPHGSHIAQERNNSSIVLTEMSAGYLEVSIADQYSTNRPKKNYLYVKH
jgi:hypothetical protein